MVNFSKFCSESLHVDTDIDVVVFKFREIWPTGNRRNRALLTDKKKQNFGCLSNCRYRSSPQQCAHSAPNFIEIGSHFSGVMAECVNTVFVP